MKARRLKGNVLGPRASYQPQTESSSEQSVVEVMLKLARDKYFHSSFPANERDQGSDLSGPGDWSGNGQRTTGSPTQYSSLPSTCFHLMISFRLARELCSYLIKCLQWCMTWNRREWIVSGLRRRSRKKRKRR